MSQNSLPEKNPSNDPFGKPDHTLPDKFKTKGPNSGNPYSINLTRELILGPDVRAKKDSKSNPNPGKYAIREGGVSRSKFKQALEHTHDIYAHLNKIEKGNIVKDMEWRKYGEEISKKDVEKFTQSLKNDKSEKQNDKTKDEIRILKKVEFKK